MKLTTRDIILVLLAANENEPVPSLEHLKAEVFLAKKILGP